MPMPTPMPVFRLFGKTSTMIDLTFVSASTTNSRPSMNTAVRANCQG